MVKVDVGPLRAVCPERVKAAYITLAVNELPGGPDETHLVNDATCLETPVRCDDRRIQPNGEPLEVSMKVSVTLCVTACGVPQTVMLTEVYFAKNVVHNLI
ncbi:hypothetical protein PHPALM_19705 [Phytophthora palmivora]|uniref:Uncharacterized protein n=1 Tax=Phytophthora palmivora TaxID=4796 RepID=A0A2P4XGQ7_9STRA|nr:hypothetical protein PHPALM_19705 [Phytophthora palmivora]